MVRVSSRHHSRTMVSTLTRPFERLTQLLSLVDFLEPLSAEALDELAGRISCESLRAGETFDIGSEEHAERMLLVLRGRVQLCERAHSGNELTIAVVEYGTPLGATGLASRAIGQRELCARALEPSLIGGLDREYLEEVVDEEPQVALRLAQLTASRLVQMEERWVDLGTKEVKGRLASMLVLLVESEGLVTPEGHYRITTRYTHHQLGSMIGSQREAVSRAIGGLREEGCIEVRSRQIYVKDFEALRRNTGE